jgi:sirohydrochlorin cobaltochelatase
LKAGIILFAHGSREPQWARPFESLAAALSKSHTVRVAYLELMQPSLADAVAALASEGVQTIRVVPVFLAAGKHLRDDLPRLAALARERCPGVQIDVEPPIGEQASVIDAIAAAIGSGGRSSP